MSKNKTHKTENGKEFLISGGVYTGYTFTDKQSGNKSVIAFDNVGETKEYLDKRESTGERHFMDLKK